MLPLFWPHGAQRIALESFLIAGTIMGPRATMSSTNPAHAHDAAIRAYDEAGDVIENARARGRFQRAVIAPLALRLSPSGNLCYTISDFNRPINPLESFLPIL